MSNITITDYLTQERTTSVAAAKVFFENITKKYGSIDPTFSEFIERLTQYSLIGGKWGRPTLTRLAYALTSSDTQGSIVSGSMGIELFHRYLLIHDDLVDRDLLRHGQPTLEQQYLDEVSSGQFLKPIEMHGKGMALFSGDWLMSLAEEAIIEAGFSAETTIAVLHGLHECMTYTAAGWRLETILKQQPIGAVSEAQVLKAPLLVSAHYSVLWPLRFGQLFGGIEYGKWNRALDEYGEKVGQAFQIQDDILGMFGNEAETGKPVGNDLREGKKSLLVFMAYQNGTAQEREFLEREIGTQATADTIAKVQEIITKRSLNEVRTRMRSLAAEGVASLGTLPDSAQKHWLTEFAAFLTERDH